MHRFRQKETVWLNASCKRIPAQGLRRQSAPRPTRTQGKGIFYDGQIFDAYEFVSRLVKSARKNIVLIDNYVDESVLILMDKRSPSIKAALYTNKITDKFKLDIEKHNAQYPPVEIHIFNKAHDRFLIIDDKVYHIGASLKDLGKKWFAFSLLQDLTPQDLLGRI